MDTSDGATREADDDTIDVEALIMSRGAPARVALEDYVVREQVRRRRVIIGMIGLIVVGVVGWGLFAAQTISTLQVDVTEARDQLAVARDTVLEGELLVAADGFERSAELLSDVEERASGVLLLPLRLVPTYGRNLGAIAGLSGAGARASAAAADVSAALGATVDERWVLSPVDDTMPVQQLQELAPVLNDAAEELQRAAEGARAVASSGIDPRVADARSDLVDVLGPVADAMSYGARLSEGLPRIFGAAEPRRYALLVVDPTEARGTGGRFTSITMLDIVNGELAFGETMVAEDIPTLPEGAIEWPDRSLGNRYDIYGGLRFFHTINFTPDFPSAALAVEAYLEAAMGVSLDGVIALDPFAAEGLAEITGTVSARGRDLGSDEIVEFVTVGAYAAVDDGATAHTIASDVVIGAMRAFTSGGLQGSPAQLLEALARLTERDAIQMHSVHPDEQDLLVEGGLAGDFSDHDADLLAIVLNSGSGNRADAYLRRSVDYHVDLGDNGLATGTITLGFANDAPRAGGSDFLLGDGDTVPPGTTRSYVSVYAAPESAFFEFPDVGVDGVPTTDGDELGFQVTSTWMDIAPQRTRELVYARTTPDAWFQLGGDIVYDVRYHHQTWATPTALSLSVAVPSGFEVREMPDEAQILDGRVEWEVMAFADTDYRLRFAAVNDQ